MGMGAFGMFGTLMNSRCVPVSEFRYMMAAFRLCRTFHLTRGLFWCRVHSGRSHSSRASRHWPSRSISVVVAAVGSGLLAWKSGWFGLPQLNASRVRLVLCESCTTCVRVCSTAGVKNGDPQECFANFVNGPH